MRESSPITGKPANPLAIHSGRKVNVRGVAQAINLKVSQEKYLYERVELSHNQFGRRRPRPAPYRYAPHTRRRRQGA